MPALNAMLLVKATLLLSFALLGSRAMRRASGSARHRLWSVVFMSLLALPLLASGLPALYVPVSSDVTRAFSGSVRPVETQAVAGSDLTRDVSDAAVARDVPRARDDGDAIVGEPAPSSSRFDLRTWLVGAWSIGAIAAIGMLVLSLLRTRRLADAARRVDDPSWQRAADALAARLGVRARVRLLASAVPTPMAGGVWRPTIFLPASCRDWSPERREVVLAHEIAHLAGRDPLRHIAARLAIALYWFHPLAWIAAKQATIAREQACDEAVLALGTRPSVYARVLLELAASMQPSPAALAALPMVERRRLETRLMTILNSHVPRTIERRALLPAIVVTLVTLSVAAAQPAGPPSTPDVKPVEAPKAMWAEATQTDTGRDSACWWNVDGGASFSGNLSMTQTPAGTIIREQVGRRGLDRVIQKTFDGVRLCMLAENVGDRDDATRPSQWPGIATRLVLEARRGNSLQRLTIARQQALWQVDGKERPVDAAVQQWRERMLALLDTTWELSMLRGQVSSLRGEISSIRGHQSSLRGQISSLRGHVSSLRGMISSFRGHESSLRGQISSIQGHLSALRGAISSERGAISSLNAARYDLDRADRDRIANRLAQHEAEIARIEQTIRDYNAEAKIREVEKEIASLDTAGRVARVEAQIRDFDLEGQTQAIERQIAALDVEGKTRAIERQIEALDVDRRSQELQTRRDAQLKELEAAIARIP